MMQYTTPPSYGSTVVNVGGIARDGEILAACASNSALHPDIKGDPENDWPEPGAAKFVWCGKTKDDKAVDATVEGALGTRVDRVDVMAEVPGFVKAFVGNVVGTKPYIYQVHRQPDRARQTADPFQYLTPLDLDINIGGGDKAAERGVLFSEAVFIS